MKITKQYLKQIIKEELSKNLKEVSAYELAMADIDPQAAANVAHEREDGPRVAIEAAVRLAKGGTFIEGDEQRTLQRGPTNSQKREILANAEYYVRTDKQGFAVDKQLKDKVLQILKQAIEGNLQENKNKITRQFLKQIILEEIKKKIKHPLKENVQVEVNNRAVVITDIKNISIDVQQYEDYKEVASPIQVQCLYDGSNGDVPLQFDESDLDDVYNLLVSSGRVHASTNRNDEKLIKKFVTLLTNIFAKHNTVYDEQDKAYLAEMALDYFKQQENQNMLYNAAIAAEEYSYKKSL